MNTEFSATVRFSLNRARFVSMAAAVARTGVAATDLAAAVVPADGQWLAGLVDLAAVPAAPDVPCRCEVSTDR